MNSIHFKSLPNALEVFKNLEKKSEFPGRFFEKLYFFRTLLLKTLLYKMIT